MPIKTHLDAVANLERDAVGYAEVDRQADDDDNDKKEGDNCHLQGELGGQFLSTSLWSGFLKQVLKVQCMIIYAVKPVSNTNYIILTF